MQKTVVIILTINDCSTNAAIPIKTGDIFRALTNESFFSNIILTITLNMTKAMVRLQEQGQ